MEKGTFSVTPTPLSLKRKNKIYLYLFLIKAFLPRIVSFDSLLKGRSGLQHLIQAKCHIKRNKIFNRRKQTLNSDINDLFTHISLKCGTSIRPTKIIKQGSFQFTQLPLLFYLIFFFTFFYFLPHAMEFGSTLRTATYRNQRKKNLFDSLKIPR